jgi:hypothetical protein
MERNNTQLAPLAVQPGRLEALVVRGDIDCALGVLEEVSKRWIA